MSRTYLLTWEYAGRTWRLADQAVTVPSDDGDLVFGGGLTVGDVSEEAAASGVSSARSLPLTMALPEDVSGLVELGHDITAGAVELSVVEDGEAWEDREVLLLGTLDAPEYGGEGEPLTASLVETSYDDRGLVVPSSAAVRAGVSWSAPDEGVEGEVYPTVMGQPGWYPDASQPRRSGSPGLLVQTTGSTRYLLVADGDCAAVGDTVHVFDSTDELSDDLEVLVTRDDLGRTVSVVDLATSGTLTATAGHEYWVSWDQAGGGWNRGRSGALTGAGDVLLEMLTRSTVEWDRPATEALRARLNAWSVSACIAEAVAPLDWITRELLPLLPVTLVPGPRGLSPVFWDYEATSAAAMDEITVGSDGLSRPGPMRVEGTEEVLTELTLRWALRARTDEYMRVSTWTGDPSRAGEENVTSTATLRQAWARYGLRALELETALLTDAVSANLTLAWLAASRALPRRVLTLDCDRRYTSWRPGRVVLVTDSTLQLERRVALVRSAPRGRTGGQLELVLHHHGTRDLRGAA